MGSNVSGLRRTWCAIAAALCLAGAAQADEHAAPAQPVHAEPAAKPAVKATEKPAEKPAEKAADKPSAHGAPAVAPAAAAQPRVEPSAPAAEPAPRSSDESLTRVRDLLAEKLGARQTAKATGPYDVRIPSRGEEGAPEARRARGAGSRTVVVAAPVAVETHAQEPAHWSYDGETGPNAWAGLRPDFAQCATGKRQSPIDIRDGIAVQLDAVKFDYRPSGFRVIDNGHTVQVNVAQGNSIEVLGRRYELLQFHFHRPSEERINGRQYDMVAHLVHKDPEGRLAVVAVLLDRGAAQSVIQSVWNNLPLERNEEVAAQVAIDLNQLLPEDRRYYTYMGSLTTPPCSEGVLWMVMKQPVPISPEQVNVFSRLYPMNARPLQAASGRLIKESQ